jgi:hypothetical protein
MTQEKKIEKRYPDWIRLGIQQKMLDPDHGTTNRIRDTVIPLF